MNQVCSVSAMREEHERLMTVGVVPIEGTLDPGTSSGKKGLSVWAWIGIGLGGVCATAIICAFLKRK